METWFRHDYNAHDDLKIRKLLRNYGECAYGAYWLIVELLYQEGGSASADKISDTFELMSSPNMKQILEESGLFQIARDGSWSSNRVYEEIKFQNVARQKKSNAGKIGMANRWGNNVITDDNNVITQPNTPITQDNTLPNHTIPYHNITPSVSKDTSSPSGKSVSQNQSKFTPPSVEEVRNYCRERQNNVDPENFVDFYTSKNWMVGKTKMKDWKASVRTWEKDKTHSQSERNDFYGGKYIKGTNIQMDLVAKGADRSMYTNGPTLEDLL